MKKSPVLWIIKEKDGRVGGPYSTSAVLNLISQGAVTGEELIAEYPSGNWLAVSTQPEFYDRLLDVLEGKTSSPKVSRTEIEAETVIVSIPVKKKPETPTHQEVQVPIKPDETLGKKQEDDVIDLVSAKQLSREGKKKQNKLIFAIFGVAVILFIFALFFGDDELSSDSTKRVRLLAPGRGQEKLSNEAVDELKKKAIEAIESDNFSDYLEAQNLLVRLAEANEKDTLVRQYLCLVYKELWPYAYQDDQDERTLSYLTQSTKNINPTVHHGKTCEVIRLMLLGKYRESKSQVDYLMSLYGTEIIYFLLKTEMLISARDFLSAKGFVEYVLKYWPNSIRGKILAAEVSIASADHTGASRYLKEVLKLNPDHKEANIRWGMFAYYQGKRVDEAIAYLTKGLHAKERAPRQIEASGYLALGEIMLLKGERRKAISYAKEGYRLNPGNSEIRKLLLDLGQENFQADTDDVENFPLVIADQYARNGDCQTAQAEYKAAFELNPKNAKAAFKAAKCLWQINQSSEAILFMRKAIDADPKYVPSYIYLADYLSQRFDFGGANQALLRAKAVGGETFEVVKEIAQVELRKRNYAAALAYAQKAEKLYDADSEVFILKAKAQIGMNNGKDAIDSALKAIEIDNSSAEAHVAYALAQRIYNGIDAAIAYMQGQIQTTCQAVDCYLGLAEILKKEDRFEKAYEIYKTAVQVDPKSKEAKLGLGECLTAMGDINGALQGYLGAATLDVSDAEPLFRAAMLYYRTGSYEVATQQLKRVIKVNPLYPMAHFYLGKIALINKDYNLALSESAEEKKINPDLADPYILAGEVYFEGKKFSSCAVEYQEAIKRSSGASAAYIKLAACYRLMGSYEVAKQMLELARKTESGNQDLYKEYGALYHSWGNSEAALEAYETYLKLSPNAPDARQIEGLINELQMKK